jgi:hypothetical protein
MAGLTLAIDLTALLSVTAAGCRWLRGVLGMLVRRCSVGLDRFCGWACGLRTKLVHRNSLRRRRFVDGIGQKQHSAHNKRRNDDCRRKLPHVSTLKGL